MQFNNLINLFMINSIFIDVASKSDNSKQNHETQLKP